MATESEMRGVFTTIMDVWQRRRTRRILSSLDDLRLKDIGLFPGSPRATPGVHEPTQRWLDSLR